MDQLQPEWNTLLQSADAQALMRRLRQNGGSALQDAVRSAQSGDAETAKAALAPLLQDPQTAELLRRLSGGV